jgi:parallel beta-helix repeat protein
MQATHGRKPDYNAFDESGIHYRFSADAPNVETSIKRRYTRREMKHPRGERSKAAFSLLAIFSFLLSARFPLACDFNEISANPAQAVADVAAATSGKTVCFGAGKYRMANMLAPTANGVTLSFSPGADLDGSLSLNNSWSPGPPYSESARAAGVTLSMSGNTGSGFQCQSFNEACLISQDLYYDGVPLQHLFYNANCTGNHTPTYCCTGSGTGTCSVSHLPPTLSTGQYVIDYTGANGGTIYLYDNPAGHLVEMSNTAHAIAGMVNNLTVSGGTFEKYATPLADAAIMANNASNWNLTGAEIKLNHGVGFENAGSRAANNNTIQNSNVHDNGQEGIGCGGNFPTNNIGTQILNNKITNNGWAATVQYDCGGIKCSNQGQVGGASGSGATIIGNYVWNNDCAGIWTDTGASNYLIANNTVGYSVDEGIRIENSHNILVRSNTLMDNVQSRVARFGLSFSATGACTGGGLPEIFMLASDNSSAIGNSITTNCGGIRFEANRWDYSTGYLVRSNRITYCGAASLNGSATGGASYIPNWAANTLYSEPSCASCSLTIVDSNDNIQATAPGVHCISGDSVPAWSTTPGGTTTDGTCSWTMKAANPDVYTNCSALPCFDFNKYFFASSAAPSNTNWVWGGQGLSLKTWSQWQAQGQDPHGTATTTGAICNPQESARLAQ